MKSLLAPLFFFVSVFTIQAQQKNLDSLYKVQPVQTEVYAEKAGEKLIIDLYLPQNNSEDKPLIIFMHGGGFSGGSPKNEQEVRFANIAAAKGYAVGLISYRLTRKGQSFGCDYPAEGKIETFKLAAEDFMESVYFMMDHAEKFGIDPENLIVGGSSAGAEAVLNAVYNPELMLEKQNKKVDFKAVISLAGAILDVRYLTEKNNVPGLFFHGTADNLVPYATAPHHYCEPDSPGYLVLDGSKTITEKLAELDTSYLFYTYKDAGHEISGMPFKELPHVFEFLKDVVFEKHKIQSTIYR
ncbi:alpha/beta hydrolase [Gramella sp. AN32]|uniref:Alpha/beta hydrolase n=1 Tax=Christiangramia antarctica TaxID=2058158 RepID=A0ABW5X348_9FLAO|nr:alpha/beta hydrolase [Gramella sp. AN32]MCM4157218.1 carboxylesterase [Gramella sp. AN32]